MSMCQIMQLILVISVNFVDTWWTRRRVKYSIILRNSTATKMSLVHIAGYVTRNDEALDEDHLLDVTTFYYQKYRDFTKELDRGGLNIPSDSSCQWSIFCYLMFNQVKHSVCQKSLSNLFMVVSDMHTFNMKRNHARILSNIFFKNHCAQNTPRSTKEAKQKVLKLSVECWKIYPAWFH